MQNFPTQKEFELKINIKKKILFFNKTKIILLKYKEASVLEVIEFLQLEKQIIEYFSDFILKNSNATKKDLWKIILNFDKIWEKINNTFLKFENKNTIKKTNNSKNSETISWFNSYLVILSEKLNIDPLELLKKYTLRQFNYLTEWIIYNANDKTKEWKQKNRMDDIQKQRENLNNEDAKKIKDFIYSD